MKKPASITLLVLLVIIGILGYLTYRYLNTPIEVHEALAPKDNTTESLIQYNQELVQSEEQAILDYIKTSNTPFQKTPQGIYYHIITPGSGTIAQTGNKVMVSYKLYFLNDSLVLQAPPTPMIVGGGNIMLGIDDAIKELKPGGKLKAIIPFNWAYGVIGNPPAIPPYAPLICTLEFIQHNQ